MKFYFIFRHLARNWSIKKKSSTPSSTRRKTKLNLLLMQRIKKHSIRKRNDKKKNEMNSNLLYKM